MVVRMRRVILAGSMAALLAAPVLAEAPPTVWHALGIPQTFTHFRDAKINAWGKHPKLEARPPLRAAPLAWAGRRRAWQ